MDIGAHLTAELQGIEPVRVLGVQLKHFRNIASGTWFPGPAFNVLSGANGSGKTNWIEALGVVSTRRSFRGAPRPDWIREGEGLAQLSFKLDLKEGTKRLDLQVRPAGKMEYALDGVRWHKESSLPYLFPVEVFHPGDAALIGDSDSIRRDFLDTLLVSLDPSFSRIHQRYQKTLVSRNRLFRLGHHERALHRPYERLLAESASLIMAARERLILNLTPIVEAVIAQLHAEPVKVRLCYEPTLPKDSEAACRAYEQSFDDESRTGFTRKGPHADRCYFELAGRGARYQASAGQARMLVLALKLGAFALRARAHTRLPVLLLDDVTSELDEHKRERLFELLAGLGCQVFITTTHPSYIKVRAPRSDVSVTQGTLTPLHR